MFSKKLSLLLFVFAGLSSAQGIDFVKANYTKYEFRIPMRDGVHLFTSVYVPKDASPALKYPIMYDRTPYSVAPYGVDNFKTQLGPSELFARDKYIFVYQDVRGRLMSEGTFVDMRPQIDDKKTPQDIDESSDTYDSIDWLVKNVPNNNGKVGMWGISYPGFYTAAGMLANHPALVAVSPQAPITDWFVGDDFHHNGALYLPHAFNFISSFGLPRPEPVSKAARRQFEIPVTGYQFYLNMGPLTNANEKYLKNNVAFWDEMMKHPNYDAFWQARNLRPHLRGVKPAVMTVGGWFDAEDLFGAQQVYKMVRSQSPETHNMLVMGPWFHGGWARGDGDHLGFAQFDAKTSLFYREKIELPFFQYYLKGKADPNLPGAYVFETGSNQWRTYDAWPPAQAAAKTLYLHANGKLSFVAPTKDEGSAYDEYVSDPAKPVPYISEQAAGMTREHMTEDQRFAESRTDVLSYVTDPLTDDVTFAGALHPKLEISTSGTDSDFVVKLIDVYPADYPDPDPNPVGVHMGGFEQLIRGEVFRGRFRNGFDKPEAFTPNKLAKIDYAMPDINHCFRRGHRIMVQIQSTWFPLVDRNPQKFVDIYNAKTSDFQKATERVYHSASEASQIEVSILPGY
ncbi:MAG TPA: CocE/NonD family hydrolase [Bryobacteraceae bacterium]|nr:CocE/NonD family hydrolase [Bryobacteraceae bacterium]